MDCIHFIRIVACRHDNDTRVFVFQAPPEVNIGRGDRVMCETRYGRNPATVVGSIIVRVGEPVYKFIIDTTGATEPLKKIVGVYEYTPIEEYYGD